MEFNQVDSLKKLFLNSCKTGNMVNVKACLQLKVDYNTKEISTVDTRGGERYLRTKTASGCTGLHYAVYNENYALVKLLLALPLIDVNIKNSLGQTPFSILLDPDEYTPYAFAWMDREENRRMQIIEEFLKSPKQNLDIQEDPRRRGFSQASDHLSFLAIKNGGKNLRIMELLSKDERMNWNVKNREGLTPIQVAFKQNREDVFDILMRIEAVDKSVLPQLLVKKIHEKMKATNQIKAQCPVCLNGLTTAINIFQCIRGHFVCGTCSPNLHHCPLCRDGIMGRAYGMENFLKDNLK